jgi:hypothetical protein
MSESDEECLRWRREERPFLYPSPESLCEGFAESFLFISKLKVKPNTKWRPAERAERTEIQSMAHIHAYLLNLFLHFYANFYK